MNEQAPYRLASFTLYVLLVATLTCDPRSLLAQGSRTSLARTYPIHAGRGIAHVYATDVNGDGRDELVLFGDSSFVFKSSDSSGWQSHAVTLRPSVAELYPGRSRRDKRTLLLALAVTRDALSVYRLRPDHRLRLLSTVQIHPAAEQMTVGDITNDGKPDLLLFGKKESGIRVYPGSGDGAFGAPATILPDYSFDAVVVADFNSDGINDLAAVNWIQNEVLLFTSFGKLKFSDPSKLPLSAIPSSLRTVDFNRDGLPDLLVSADEPPALLQFENDGFGSFKEQRTIALGEAPRSFEIADVNGDSAPDVGCLFNNSLLILLNDGKGTLRETVPFAAGSHPADFTFFQTNQQTGAAILDTTRNELRLLVPSNTPAPENTETRYATGAAPGAVLVLDVNRDGSDDLLVANSGSKTVSLFLGHGGNPLDAQIAFSTDVPIDRLRPIATNDSTSTVLGFRSAGDSMAIISLHSNTRDHEVLVVPTQGSIDPLATRVDSASHRLHLLALERAHARSYSQLVEYEQITATRFLERTFTSLTKDTILAAAMDYNGGEQLPILVYATFSRRRHTLSLCVAKSRAHEEFAPSRVAATLDVSELDESRIWIDDLNNDGMPDVVLNLGPPLNKLYTAMATTDSTFAPPVVALDGEIDLTEQADLQPLDHAPGRPKSLLLNNALTRMLQTYTVRSDGTIFLSNRLISTRDLGGFQFVAMGGGLSGTLYATDGPEGYLRIIPVERMR